MDKEIFEGIEQGLKEAVAFTKGEHVEGVRIHKITVPEIDAKAVRSATGLSQDKFAAWCGISAGTLRNWEQGRRRPQGAARTLLYMIQKDPKAFQELVNA